MPDIYMLPFRSYLLDSLATTSMDVNPARNKKRFCRKAKRNFVQPNAAFVLWLPFRADHTFVRP